MEEKKEFEKRKSGSMMIESPEPTDRNTSAITQNSLLSSNIRPERFGSTTRSALKSEVWEVHQEYNFLYRIKPTSKIAGKGDEPYDELLYAPTKTGSWYLRFTNEKQKLDLFSGQGMEFGKANYVSVRFLATLGCASVAWKRIALREKIELKEDCASPDLEKTFITDWKELWDNRVIGSYITLPQYFVPLRRDDGAVNIYASKAGMKYDSKHSILLFKNRWYDMLKEVWKKVQWRQRRPSRWIDVKLDQSMYFELAQSVLITEDEFSKAVASLKVGNTKGFIVLKHGEKIPEGWIKYSTNPLGLYSTYIHKLDWHAYMKGLAAGDGSPIRPFPRSGTEAMNTAWRSYFEHIKSDNANLMRLMRVLDTLEDEPDIWEQRLETIYQRRPDLRQLLRKMARDEHTENIGPYGLRISSELAAAKIQAAAGKRSEEDNQTTIMGISAPKIAMSLGWTWNNPQNLAGRMRNGLYLAEWLHVSAFSYGGLLGDYNPTQTATSQMPENLIFGTSETNSLMTRYEMSWQALIKKENELRVRLGQDNEFEGELICEMNMPSHVIEYDAWDEVHKEYLRKEVNFNDDSNPRIVQSSTDATTLQNLKSVHLNYPYLAYSLSYRFVANSASIILSAHPSIESEGRPFEQETMFYPFSRPFFHRAEQALDEKLFSILIKKIELLVLNKSKIDRKPLSNTVGRNQPPTPKQSKLEKKLISKNVKRNCLRRLNDSENDYDDDDDDDDDDHDEDDRTNSQEKIDKIGKKEKKHNTGDQLSWNLLGNNLNPSTSLPLGRGKPNT